MKHHLLKFSLLLLVCGACCCSLMAQTKPFAGGSGFYKQLVWADEFNNKGLPDSTKWNYERGYIRNKELQYYMAGRLQNTRVHDGKLVITALNDSVRHGDTLIPITSASLVTKNKQSWTYGRVEVRAQIPSGLGTWPAIWMLGVDMNKVGWPACGEIDILEHVGYDPEVVHFNVHTQKYNHVKKTGKGISIPYAKPYADFHVYAVEWFADRIDWYMDDKKVFTYSNEHEGVASWPFDKPQYLILNLAFGGAWGGSKGVDVSLLPHRFVIDYVRVFQ